MNEHREPGWWLPVDPLSTMGDIENRKREIVEDFGAHPTGAEELAFAEGGTSHSVRVGDVYGRARVVAILERSENRLYLVLHTGRDFVPHVVARSSVKMAG